MHSIIDDRTNDPFDGTTASITHYVYLENEDEHSDVAKIIIINPLETGWQWEGYDLDEKWNSEDSCFVLGCCSTDNHPHSIPLGTYTAIIYQTCAGEAEYNFTVYGRGNPDMISGSVYSSYQDDTPRILRIPTSCSASLTGNDLDISFTTNDEIITDAYLWFYDSGGSYLGRSGWLSETSPVITNGINNYTLDISGFPGTGYIYILLYSSNSGERNRTYYRSRSAKIFL